ncbi:MAG: PilT/PilU family type 4a pilus ATPase [Gemmatimonadaceae bacterium]
MHRRSGTIRSGRLWLGSEVGANLALILEEARAVKATDVHIMAGAPVLFRVGGQLQPFADEVLSASIARHLSCALLSESQVAALDEQLDIDFMSVDATQHRYRINVGYFNGTVGSTVRLLPDRPIPLEELRLPPVVTEMTQRGKGLILITGSTSQGKTTTMASMVDAINRTAKKHIITIEDPIEYLHTNQLSMVRQREVGRDTRTFSSGLRAAMRQDPDVLLIGEMRDYDTIETALRAAETGMLVLSTLHIVTIEKLMDRLLAFVPAGRENMIRAMTSESLQCVIHQELLPTVDGGKRVAAEVLVATRGVRNQIRGGTDLQLRNSIQSGIGVGMTSMQMSLDQLRFEGAISEGIYESVVKNYGAFG